MREATGWERSRASLPMIWLGKLEGGQDDCKAGRFSNLSELNQSQDEMRS